jgi:hypothetical protein
MKITRSQLRKLISEAMYDPYAAIDIAKQKVGEPSIDQLLGHEDEETRKQGHELLDVMSDYDRPSGSYDDIQDYEERMLELIEEQIPGFRILSKDEQEKFKHTILDKHVTLFYDQAYDLTSIYDIDPEALTGKDVYIYAIDTKPWIEDKEMTFNDYHNIERKIMKSLMQKLPQDDAQVAVLDSVINFVKKNAASYEIIVNN